MEIELLQPSTELFASYQDLFLEMEANGDKIWEGYLPKSGQTPEQFIESSLLKEWKTEPGMLPQC